MPSQCPYIQYVVISTNCGVCPNTTNVTNISCLNFSTSVIISARENHTCMFAVQTEICDAIIGDKSNFITVNLIGEYSIIITLKVTHFF